MEAAALFATRPVLRRVGRGDDHPVLVLPGFVASDRSTEVLRSILRAQGFHAHGWRLGRNLGPTADVVAGLGDRLDELADRHGRRVSLVGWSLGGVYARQLARARPDRVRLVITMGSPYRMRPGDASSGSGVQRLWRRVEHRHVPPGPLRSVPEEARPTLEVPATSIYTRDDGVVRWQYCIDRVGPRSENVEVRGSHVGLGVNPAVVAVVLDRLSQPEGSWEPFRPGPAVRWWYPEPVSWRASSDA